MKTQKNKNSNVQELRRESNNENLIVSTRFEGPLPHPSILDGYAKIDPDIPNRIITMAEEQSKARIENEKKENENIIELRNFYAKQETSYNANGQFYGFIILMTLILGGFTLIALNKDTAGWSSISIAIIGSIAQILYNNKNKK